MESLPGIGFMLAVFDQPLWVIIWVHYLMVINLGSVAFLKHQEAKMVLFLFCWAALGIMILHHTFGYVKLLGLPHVIFWTPMVVNLFLGRKEWPEDKKFRMWANTVLVTNSISLVIDYSDVMTYFLAE